MTHKKLILVSMSEKNDSARSVKHKSVHAPAAEAGTYQQSNRLRKIWLILGAVLFGVAALVIAVLAWRTITNPPEKQVATSLVKTIAALQEGKLAEVSMWAGLSAGGGDFKLVSSGQTSQLNGNISLKHQEVTAEIKVELRVIAEDEMYLKFDNLAQAAEQFSLIGDDFGQKVSYFNDLAKKYDGKWLKITKADLESLSHNSSSQLDCLTSLKKSNLSVYEARNFKEKLQAALRGSLTKQPNQQVGQESYSLNLSKVDWSQLGSGSPSTDFKPFATCLERLKGVGGSAEITLSVDSRLHELRSLSVSDRSQVKFQIDLPSLSQPKPMSAPNTNMPDESLPFGELKADIETILGPLNTDL